MNAGTPTARTTGQQRRRVPRRSALVVAVAGLVATPACFGLGAAGIATAAAKKPAAKASSKAVFTASQVAGTYRWVKSTVNVKLSNGKSMNGDVPYGTNDTITFVAKRVPGSNAAGTFSMNVASIGASSGTWYLQDGGTVLVWISEMADQADNAYSFRRIDQLDKKRLTMSADDRLIVRTFTENGLDEISDGVKVTGGTAYDELVRK